MTTGLKGTKKTNLAIWHVKLEFRTMFQVI